MAAPDFSTPRAASSDCIGAWTRALVVQGYVALVVDSASSRGFGQTCSASDGADHCVARPAEGRLCRLAISAGQPFVQADRIGLMGWSQGGGVVLLTVNDKSIGRPAGLAHEFRAAVSFYPGACSGTLAVEALHRGRAGKLDHASAAA